MCVHRNGSICEVKTSHDARAEESGSIRQYLVSEIAGRCSENVSGERVCWKARAREARTRPRCTRVDGIRTSTDNSY